MLIDFTLSMPKIESWNGKWTGSNRKYVITKDLNSKTIQSFMGHSINKYWDYDFEDGWIARVAAQIQVYVDKTKKTDGFSGYDWMVERIIKYGYIKKFKSFNLRN